MIEGPITQEEHALKIIKSFMPLVNSFDIAKECALLVCETHSYSENDSPFPTMKSWIEDDKYWQSIKKEIIKMT